MRNGKMVIVELISDLISRGGAETFFCNLSNSIAKNDMVELHVVILYKQYHKSFSSFFKNSRIHFHLLGKKKGIDLLCAFRLHRLITSIHPDIINGHMNYLLTYCLAFGRRKHAFKLVHTIHSFPELGGKRYKDYLSRKKRISFVGISTRVSQQALFDYPSCSIKTIYNGIPIVKNIPSKEKKWDFIIIASLTPAKNHKLLLLAFDQFEKDYGSSSLAIVGGGSLENEIKSFANGLSCVNDVTFTGQQNNVYDFLSASRVFVLSSVREGNPISILEAMNVGLPIVAPRIGGIPDVTVEEKNGFLFEVNDVSQLKSSMAKALLNAKQQNSIGKYNSIYVNNFSIENCARHYLDYFFELINK